MFYAVACPPARNSYCVCTYAQAVEAAAALHRLHEQNSMPNPAMHASLHMGVAEEMDEEGRNRQFANDMALSPEQRRHLKQCVQTVRLRVWLRRV
jgi:hypothetical protein